MRFRPRGAAAARYILDSAGLSHVQVEEVHGHLSDHYDPRHKVLRLSTEVFHSRSLASVGIAAHEAGHALQDARNYAPLVVRNMAVPAASFGSNAAFLLMLLGLFLHPLFAWVGIAAFACVVVFQLVNLPVEFNASARARELLARHGIIRGDEQMAGVQKVLGAAAWTYVAAAVSAIGSWLFYVFVLLSQARPAAGRR